MRQVDYDGLAHGRHADAGRRRKLLHVPRCSRFTGNDILSSLSLHPAVRQGATSQPLPVHQRLVGTVGLYVRILLGEVSFKL
jgi:hypothetical protein